MNTADKTYAQNPARITSTLNGYVNKMLGFTRDGLKESGFELLKSNISTMQMQLAIPYSTTPAQITAINKSIQYAQTKGITVVVTKVR